MENNEVLPQTTRRYQTRRTREIQQREGRRQERELARRAVKQLALHQPSDFDYYEDVVPVAEPDNIVRYWRISRLRQEWSSIYKRLDWPKNQLEEFIAIRRRPAIRPSEMPCPPLKYPGWYLGGAASIE